MARSKEILIIGGGVVGLSIAYYALRKGHQVALVERGASGHDCCSLGNAGMVVPSHFIPLAAPGMVAYGLKNMFKPESPFGLRPRLDPDLLHWGWLFSRATTQEHVDRSAPLLRDLNLASRRCYEELDQEIGSFGLVKKGLLMLCRSPHTLSDEAQVAKKACALGIPAEVLTPSETASLDPAVQMDIAGAIYFPLDCHLVPQDFVARLADSVKKLGARFVWEAEVSAWRTEAGRIAAAKTTKGEFTADEYVLAAGAWSAKLARKLGIRLPLQAGKGYSVTLPNPRQMPALCSILTEARVAVTPMGSALRFGGTMEIGANDRSINRPRVKGIFESIAHYLPDFSPAEFYELPVWSGLRPCSPDGLPYIGRFGKFTNLSAATGHAMMGVSLGPITGQLMADLLSDKPTEIDLQSLSPDRYG